MLEFGWRIEPLFPTNSAAPTLITGEDGCARLSQTTFYRYGKFGRNPTLILTPIAPHQVGLFFPSQQSPHLRILLEHHAEGMLYDVRSYLSADQLKNFINHGASRIARTLDDIAILNAVYDALTHESYARYFGRTIRQLVQNGADPTLGEGRADPAEGRVAARPNITSKYGEAAPWILVLHDRLDLLNDFFDALQKARFPMAKASESIEAALELARARSNVSMVQRLSELHLQCDGLL